MPLPADGPSSPRAQGGPVRLERRRKRRTPEWAHPPVYWGVRLLATGAFCAPLRGSVEAGAAAGRWWGGSRVNRKRMRRAVRHLRHAFPERDEAWCELTALRSYEHLFRLAVEFGQAPRLMTPSGWLGHVEMGDLRETVSEIIRGRPLLLITGHCGNWEILGYTITMLGVPMHALYRRLDNAPLDRWLRRTRAQRGLTLLDKFGAAERLPEMVARGVPVGFVADQNAGDRGLFVPFFGRLTSTYKTIALLAISTGASLVCGMARRVSEEELLARPRRARAEGLLPSGLRHRLEIEDVIRPGDWADAPDPVYYITARYRRAIERMVRRAPEQYLWMHRMWRSRPAHERRGKPFPASLRGKLEALPWMDEGEIERVVEQSARDARLLRELGVSRLP